MPTLPLYPRTQPYIRSFHSNGRFVTSCIRKIMHQDFLATVESDPRRPFAAGAKTSERLRNIVDGIHGRWCGYAECGSGCESRTTNETNRSRNPCRNFLVLSSVMLPSSSTRFGLNVTYASPPSRIIPSPTMTDPTQKRQGCTLTAQGSAMPSAGPRRELPDFQCDPCGVSQQ
jgi:hypothetical protein